MPYWLRLLGIWAEVSISLFNVILLLWLGLTVLLNATRRSWGTWLAGAGLLLGAFFFLAHTAALDFSIENIMESRLWWWAILAAPILALPYGWLVLMLWYCGCWDEGGAALKRRSRPGLLGATGLLIFLGNLMIFGAPRAHQSPFGDLVPGNEVQFMGFRALLVLYPIYLILCTGASVDALCHPAPSHRFMGEEARRRARPWLLASSIVQLVASICVTGVLLLTLYAAGSEPLYNVYNQMAPYADPIDLVVQICIAIAVMLLGKAVVSYEIFTGKILPRRGFWRQWRAVVLLASAYSCVIAATYGFSEEVARKLTLQEGSIILLLMTTLLTGIFVALASYRAYGERERAVTDLRAFVSSQHLYDGLVSGDTVRLQHALEEPFRALCQDVLGASRACLLARGPLAPMAGPPRLFPRDLAFRPEWTEFVSHVQSAPCASLPPESGMAWIVPLGAEDGAGERPLGALLLGEKADGGLYTIEEIDVARSAGEHLLDVGAGATLAGRLMNLQRQRLAEVQMLDRRARRVLHDDILPQLHTALLTLGGAGASPEAIESLTSAHRGISDLLREMPAGASPLGRRGLVGALRHEIEGELAGAFDSVAWHIDPAAEAALETLPPLTAETLFFAAREAARNSAKYGRGDDATRKLNLNISACRRDGVELEILDDGQGVLAGSNGPAGTGHGLALHGTLLAVAGGQLSLEESKSGGARVLIRLPEQAFRPPSIHGAGEAEPGSSPPILPP